MSLFTLILVHHLDAGHGWIEIPSELVSRLGILSRVSSYSYYSHDSKKFYLEEDCDAEILIEALKSSNIDFVIRPEEHDGLCFIRNLSRVGQV